MTQAQRQTLSSAALWVKDYVPVIASMLTIALVLGGGITWLAGGITLQTQVTSSSLAKQVTDIQGDISLIKQRLDVLPNTYEVGDWRTHFGKLDDRIGKLEAAEGKAEVRVDTLERLQFRNTRCATC